MVKLHKAMTPEEYAAAQDRSRTVKLLVNQTGVAWLPVCFHVGKSYQTVAGWLRAGLSLAQYDRLLRAISAAKNAKN